MAIKTQLFDIKNIDHKLKGTLQMMGFINYLLMRDCFMYLKKPYMHITLKVVHKFSTANQVKLVMIT